MHDATATIAPAPQHMQALRRANEVRLARAQLKRRVGDGTVSVSEVIRECPWESASMTVIELLLSQRRWGTTRCSKLLAHVDLPEGKTIGAMTERQRRALASALISP
jgi:hypothetical protein